jgi:hypothetical protein
MLLGRGRSGTTWVARMLTAHEDCLYKFEPFHSTNSSPYMGWLQRIASESSYADRYEDFIRICMQPVPSVDYPPFRRRIGQDRSPLAMRCSWQMSKWSPKMEWLFSRYGRADSSQVRNVFIKDVNFPNELLPPLWEAIHPRVIALLKNPFSSVVSARRFYGASTGVKAEWIARVRELMRFPGHERYQRFDDQLEKMSFEAFEAVRWRIQNEPLFDFVSTRPDCMSITYEQCCLDPLGSVSRMCKLAGWPCGDSIRREVELLTDGKPRWWDRRRGRYNTRRSPLEMMDSWRSDISVSQMDDIASIVHDSPLLGLWSDL